MEHTTETKTDTLMLALLCATLLACIACLHAHKIVKPITIPQVVEMKWASDTSWGKW